MISKKDTRTSEHSPRHTKGPTIGMAIGAVGIALALTVIVSPARAGGSTAPIETLLETRELTKTFNPVLLEFLLAEGSQRLPDPIRLEAIDQTVTALKSDIDIKPGEQRAAAWATAAGALAEAFGGDTAAEGGAAVYGAAYEVWEGWIDSAYVLQRAGYTEDALAFFERCVAEFPITELRARCVAGLATAKPDEALRIVMGFLDESTPVVDAALRLLGDLASLDATSEEHRAQILATHEAHLRGLNKATHGPAAIDGLIRGGNPAAAPVLRGLTKGFLNAELKPLALRGLLLTFGDQSVVPLIDKRANAGALSATEPADKLQAGALLLEAGEQAGYRWATAKLTKKQKRGLAKKMSMSADEPDLRPQIVEALVTYGDSRAIDVLKQAIAEPGSWLETRIAIALLEKGDASRQALARRAFQTPEWGLTQIRLVEALAAQGDMSGIPRIESLFQDGGSSGGKTEYIRRQRQLRIAAAHALARIDHADAVPILANLFADRDATVAATAAYALARMSVPEAFPYYRYALDREYGSIDGRPLAPLVWATLVRSAGAQFRDHPFFEDILAFAAQRKAASVRLLALATGP